MSTAGALAGWIAAGVALTLLAIVRRALTERTTAVARACHELRGPLAAVRLGLSPPADGELPRHRLRAIDAELGRAALALEDLAEIRGGGMGGAGGAGGACIRRVERVDVRSLVADSVEAWRATAESRGAMLGDSLPGPAVDVWGDRRRLAQAVGNLLANAIEHGGGRIEVHVARRGGLVRAEVSDDGRGLPAPVADLSRRGRRARGAHGHGLAIAASIAEVHGGRLAAAPAHVGARLVLELPAAGPSRWPTSSRAVTPAPIRRPKAAR
jgi:signal transduction histidine kinase